MKVKFGKTSYGSVWENIGGNDTVPNLVWLGESMPSTECCTGLTWGYLGEGFLQDGSNSAALPFIFAYNNRLHP